MRLLQLKLFQPQKEISNAVPPCSLYFKSFFFNCSLTFFENFVFRFANMFVLLTIEAATKIQFQEILQMWFVCHLVYKDAIETVVLQSEATITGKN